jgi:hypothetical protein
MYEANIATKNCLYRRKNLKITIAYSSQHLPQSLQDSQAPNIECLSYSNWSS